MINDLHREGGFSVMEYFVAVSISTFILVLGILVWSNMRGNVREARARDNREHAVSEVKAYWDRVGEDQKHYRNLTADYMNEFDTMARWDEKEPSQIEGGEDLSPEFYRNIYIVRDGGTPADEISVATFAESGTVYFARFKGAMQVEKGELTLRDFTAMRKRERQTQAALAGSW